MQKEKQIIKIEKNEAEGEGCIGKYLNKHIVPGYMYVVEDDTNLVGSCLYNIDKPMMVVTYKSYEQFLKDATKSEIAANLSDTEKTACNISDEMIADKQLELANMPINYKTGVHTTDYMLLFNFCWQMKGHKVVLIDDYQPIVEEFHLEFPSNRIHIRLQNAMRGYGVTVIAQKYPLIIEDNEPVEIPEPILWITGKYGLKPRESRF